jgi:hypothetical protein
MPRREGQQRMTVVPCSQRQANAYVSQLHRHHRPPRGSVFQLAVIDEEGLVRGVAMVGRPLARMLQDGYTLEVNRVATDGCQNACSALYGAAWRTVRGLGYRRLFTYTLPQEGGASLRGSGWTEAGLVEGNEWRGRFNPEWQGLGERANDWPTSDKTRWVKVDPSHETAVEIQWPDFPDDDGGPDVFDYFGP